jgi:preprotein translocase subunit SecG
MAFLIGLMTLVMVLDCLLLILLVLIQLPKKEAGAGLAFGGGATDALFGAGSGTVLTKITKYAAAGFFVMAVILSVLQSNYHRRTGREFINRLETEQTQSPGTAPMVPTTPAKPSTNVAATSNPPAAEDTNATVVPTPAPSVPALTNIPNGAPPPAGK